MNKAKIAPIKSLHLRNMKCVCLFSFICFGCAVFKI